MIGNHGYIFVALALALGGCAAGDDGFATSPAGYVQDAGPRVAAADWAAAETVEIVLSEYEFEPADLTFRAGTPYRLRLRNTGDATHYFAAADFFKAIAAQRLTRPGDAVETPLLTSIAVPPGASKTLSFVPVERGAYDVECTAPLHAVFGMVGTATII